MRTDLSRLATRAVGLSVLAYLVAATGCSGGCDEPGSSIPTSRDVSDAGASDAAAISDVTDVTDADTDDTRRADSTDADAETGPDIVDAADGLDHLYETLREVQSSLRASPDHLPARADELVEEGDAEELYQFVRDRISVIPADGRSMGELATGTRWGLRATLRSGQGTVREKADLLQNLLERAGYDATVVGPWRSDELDREMLERIVWQQIDRKFEPDTTEREVREWRRVLDSDRRERASSLSGHTGSTDAGRSSSGDVSPLGPSRRDEVLELAERIRDKLPSGFHETEPYEFDESSGLPLVRVDLDDGARVINPHDPEASFDDDYSTGSLTEAPSTDGTLPVEVDVSYARAHTPNTWQTAVAGSWTADQLAGRRLHLDFLAGANPQSLIGQSVGDLRVFRPALLVDGRDISEEEQKELSTGGNLFTRDGRPVEISDDGEQANIGRHIVDVASDADQLAGEVRRLETSVDASSFPCVDVKLNAFDGSERRIRGLRARDFELREQGELESPTLLQNRARPPRVLFLLDTSGSVPNQFRDSSTVQFFVDVANGVSEEFDRAKFAAVADGAVPGPSTEDLWKDDPEQLRKQAQDVVSTSSSGIFWKSIASAVPLEPTVMVVVTDAQFVDKLTTERREALNEGPPALTVAVGDPKQSKIRQIADLTDGEWFEARTPDQIEPPLFGFLRRYNKFDHLLRYHADLSGSDSRTVEVGSAENDGVAAEATYSIPPTSERGTCPSPIARLRTRVRVGDVEVKRPLAGPAHVPEETDRIQRDPAQVMMTLFGNTTFFFESAHPPTSVWTEEFVDGYVSREKRTKSLARGDPEAWLEQMDKGGRYNPIIRRAASPGLHSPLDGTRTYPTGLRASILQERIDPLRGERVREFDILPTAGFETMVSPTAAEPLEPAMRWRFEGDLSAASGDGESLEPNRGEHAFTDGREGAESLELADDDFLFIPDRLYDRAGLLGGVSVCAWTRTESGGAVVSWDPQNYFQLEIRDDGRVEWTVTSRQGWTHTLQSSTAVDDGKWHHVCGTFRADSGTGEVFVDGTGESESDWWGDDAPVGTGVPRYGVVGAMSKSSFYGDRGTDESSSLWRGAIDDLRVYERSLSESDIQALADGDEVTDRAAQSKYETLEETARLAVAESVNFESDQLGSDGRELGKSTRSMLEGESLVTLSPDENWSADKLFPLLDEEERQQWRLRLAPYRDGDWYALVPEDGTPGAFWAVDADSGAMYGILPDGSGGAVARYRAKVERIRKNFQEQIDAYSTANTASSAPIPGDAALGAGAGLGVASRVAMWLARTFGAATIALAVLPSANMEIAKRAAIVKSACNAVRDLAWSDGKPNAGAALSLWVLRSLEQMVSSHEGYAGFNCPTSIEIPE